MSKSLPDELINIKIRLHEKQEEALRKLDFHKCVLYGGARGGGKSYFMRKVQLVKALSQPGYLGIIFRRYYKDLKTNHIIKFQQEHPELDKYFRKGDLEYFFPQLNSHIMFRSVHEEGDLPKYKGAEIQGLGIDECDEMQTDWIIRLRQSNRSSNPNIKPFTLLCGNPGGQSHQWMKRVFVDRKFEENEKPDDYAFVQALLEDNPALNEADPDYRNNLLLERDLQIRKAWLKGDWNIELGQFFSEWNPKKHVIDVLDPRKDLKGWYKYGAMDWGYSHPCVFGWWAINPETGQNIMYREYLTRRKNPHQVLQDLFKFDDTFELKYVSSGHDCWNVQRDGGPSVAEQFYSARPFRLNLLDTHSRDRIGGWAQLRAGLQWEGVEEGIPHPMIQFTRNCKLTIDSIPRIQHDKRKIEDCEKINCDEKSPIGSGDDQVDMIRHAVMSRPPFNKYIPPKVKNLSHQQIRAYKQLILPRKTGWTAI